MSTPSSDAALADDPPLGFPEDVTVEQIAMLDELVVIAMNVARTLDRKVAATGDAAPADVKSLNEVMHAARRTMVLRNKLVADSRMTPAELAAAKARRDAALARRDAARAASLLRTRKAALEDALDAMVDADAAASGASPADTERLRQDARERLLDADIERAFGEAAYSAIILDICKALSITPRKEIWSHRLMQMEIAATAEQLRRFEAGLQDSAAQTGRKLPPTAAGLGNGPGPGGSYPKIGRFNFDATGAVESVGPPDDPPSSWTVPPRWRLDSG